MTDKFGELNQILSDQCEAQALTIGISDLMEKLSDNFVKDSTEREYLEIHKESTRFVVTMRLERKEGAKQ